MTGKGTLAQTGDSSAPGDAGQAMILCRGLWMLFGQNASAVLRASDGDPDPKVLQEAGLIGAVRGANFTVTNGEIFIIMGLSGSGKSTLVRCLTRLITPTAGEVVFQGRDLLKAPMKELIALRRHKMGMVFQNFALLPHLTVLGNVAFPLEVQGVDREGRDVSLGFADVQTCGAATELADGDVIIRRLPVRIDRERTGIAQIIFNAGITQAQRQIQAVAHRRHRLCVQRLLRLVIHLIAEA